MSISNAQKTLILVSLWGLAGCGPTLKKKQDFTPAKVRIALFDDVCFLQSYFDSTPKPYREVTDVLRGGVKGEIEVGTVTYKLIVGLQSETFVDLLRRFYRKLPPLNASQSIWAKVRYQIRKGKKNMPIGAVIDVRLFDKTEFVLPYHPCVGAFFFGHAHYKARKALGI